MRDTRKQLRLPFPLQLVDVICVSPAQGRAAIVRDRQPKKFPKGWHRASLDNPNWREDHYDAWTEKRKAQGLPHVIHDRKLA